MKTCSMCEKEEAYIMTKSLQTKIKTYYCHECYYTQANVTIEAYEYLKKIKKNGEIKMEKIKKEV